MASPTKVLAVKTDNLRLRGKGRIPWVKEFKVVPGKTLQKNE